MKIAFLGGADEVGGTCKLVEMAGHRFVVDCGIRLGSGRSDPLPLLSLIEEAGGVEAIFITHGHADHIGAVPVFHQSYPVPVFTIDPTAQLMRIMFGDALNIMEMNTERDGRVPLYTELMAQRALDSLQLVPVKSTFQLWDGDIEVTFYPSGHIIGACSILFESAEESLFMTGDISVVDQLTVEGMKIVPIQPNVVVIESTYGGRKHLNRTLEEERVIAQVSEVLDMNGRVLFPAFAVGRAQEIILLLVRAMEEHRLQHAPIYVDGMVRQVCSMYRSLPNFTSEWMRRRIAMKGDPFFYRDSPAIPVIAKQRQHYSMQERAIFVSSSGMLTGGVSPYYAKRMANDPNSMIAITGYQDEESPGRRLQEAARQQGGSLKLGDEWVNLRCKVATYSLSAHADESQLVGVVAALKPRDVVLEHGDDNARSSFKHALGNAVLSRVHTPVLGQQLEFTPGPTRLPVSRASRNLVVNSPSPAVSLKQTVSRIAAAVLVTLTGVKKNVVNPSDAVAVARSQFPAEAGLYKVGAPDNSLVLYFGIPRRAWEQYREKIEELPALTGRTVRLAQAPHGNVLMAEARQLLPKEWEVLKTHVQVGKLKQVGVVVSEAEPDINVIRQEALEFERLTGFQLVVKGTSKSSYLPSVSDPFMFPALKPTTSEPEPVKLLEPQRKVKKIDRDDAVSKINAAFKGTLHVPMKIVILGGSRVDLVFVTPVIADLYKDTLIDLERRWGWEIQIRRDCQHNRVREIVLEIVPAQWGLKPSFRVNVKTGSVTLTIATRPSEKDKKEVSERFTVMTGYTLNFITC